MRKKLGKMLFDGVSKVFEGPNNRGEKFLQGATKVATIGGTKAKAKFSQATKKFKAKIAGIEDGIKTAAKKFKGRIDDKKIKSVAKEIKNKNKSKIIKEFLREPKMGGGMMGRQMYKKGGKSFPDLTGDGKVTKKDILKGRGVPGFKDGSKEPVRNKIKNTIEKTGTTAIDNITGRKLIKKTIKMLRNK